MAVYDHDNELIDNIYEKYQKAIYALLWKF